jgi:hypothetical protein
MSMLERVQETLTRFSTSKWALVLRYGILAAVAVYLLVRLNAVGWAELWAALPSNPLFYILFVAIYLLVPASEIPIYQMAWHQKMWPHFAYLVRKHMFNIALVGYSGEAVLIWWAKTKLGLSASDAFKGVKTNNILSALASNLATIVLLILFALTGNLALMSAGDGQMVYYVAGSVVITIILSVLIYHFRHSILDFTPAVRMKIFGIHATKNALYLGLQAVQWGIIIPQAPVSVWILFLTAQFLLTRIPFLPNKDLVFLGLTLSLTGLIDAPEAVVASMFLTSGALIQIANLVVFATTSIPGMTKGNELAILQREEEVRQAALQEKNL